MSALGDEVAKAAVDASIGSKKAVLGKLEQMLKRNGIDVDEVGRIHKVSVYQSITKNDEGEAEKHDLYGIQFDPIWKEGPEWPVVQPGPAVNVKLPATSSAVTDWPCAVVLPDIQMGFFRGVTGDLEATHDEAALSVALQIVKTAKPRQVVLVGDNLDLPEFGKYRLSPAYSQTTQAAINRATTFCAQLRPSCTRCRNCLARRATTKNEYRTTSLTTPKLPSV